jgi:UDP-glucose 4-epimerase
MRRKGVKELVFASSSSVYGEPEEIPVNENAPIRPVSVYGASKAACEALIHAYSKLYGVKAIVLRYANVVGPRLRHGVVWDLINKLLRNSAELEILGDGKRVRSYIYIEDAVEATITAWRRTEASYEVYNIASEDWVTVDEVADEVIKAMGLSDVKKSIQTSTPRSWVARRRKENSPKNRQDKEAEVQTSNELERGSRNNCKNAP